MNIFNFVKSRISIIDVVEHYSKLKKTGQYYRAICPFHSERTPSFTVSCQKNIFYCFGCNVGGDVISFIAKVENCTQIEAVRYLAQRYDLELPKEAVFIADNEGKKQSYYQLCNLVAQWCHEKLLRSFKAKKYLESRTITEEICATFCLGYFPGGSGSIASLLKYLKKNNFLLQDLLEAKIVMESKGTYYSPFEERILFPIFDHLGRCCGFGGRVFDPSDVRAKYYNSHENEFFSKRALLFGFDKAKRSIAQKSTVFLVEGYTDCLAMVKYGYTNAVATLGTACTLEHLKQLARYAKKLYVLFDDDEAGKNAIFRLAELCWTTDLDLYVVSLPGGNDPASFLIEGHAMETHIAEAVDIFAFYIQTLGENFHEKGLQDRLELTRRITQTIANLRDSLKQDLLVYKAAQVFDIPADSIRREIAQQENSRKKNPQTKIVRDKSSGTYNTIPLLEKKLFSAILSNMNSLEPEDEIFLLRYLPQPLLKVLNKAFAADDKRSLSFEQIYDLLDEEERWLVSRVVLEWPCEDSDTFQTLMRQFAKRQWKNIVSSVAHEVKCAQQNKDEKKLASLLAEFQELKLMLRGRGLI